MSDRGDTQRSHPDRFRFRDDIQGLRAVAVGLVLLYHAGLPLLPGGYVGVDVFFVISGFLITTLLVSELARTGRVSLLRFYARRARRLLPAAAVVLAATAVLVRLFVPRIRWEEIGGDIASAALYVVNWRLAERSVDYLAEDSAPSPVQHFWSLAVEEQFYLLWPVLILLAVAAAKAMRTRVRPVLWVGLAAVAVPSFLWGLALTAHSPERAFFVTTTRLWELALGALLALGAGWCARLPRRWGRAIGWGGLAAIVASAATVTAGTPWPGRAALLPTLGAAAVIVAGFATGHAGPGRLLSTRPFRWVGDLSYSLYLWHWPLLVVATAAWGPLSATRGLLVVLFSFGPAWLTHRLVENPLRFSPAVTRSPPLALSLGANATFVSVAAGLTLLLAVASSFPTSGSPGASGASGMDGRHAPGAAVLAENPRDDPAGAPPERVDFLTPDPLRATADVPDVYGDGCHQDQNGAEPLSCTYGNPDADTTVVVAGDSKIAQWLPALQRLAEHNDWRLVTYTKSACSFASAMVRDGDGAPYTSCAEWHDRVLHHLTTVETPDYVLTAQGAAAAMAPDGSDSAVAMVDGLARTWGRLVEAGAEVIVVADNPHPGMTVYQCVDENPRHLSACTYPKDRREIKGGYVAQRRALERVGGVAMVDLYDAICPVDPCAPVVGNVLIYRQGSHITATYIETLTPRLATALSRAGLATQVPPVLD
jgi:peptidoglycan/LPS O-acetylase OafA/YrhL